MTKDQTAGLRKNIDDIRNRIAGTILGAFMLGGIGGALWSMGSHERALDTSALIAGLVGALVGVFMSKRGLNEELSNESLELVQQIPWCSDATALFQNKLCPDQRVLHSRDLFEAAKMQLRHERLKELEVEAQTERETKARLQSEVHTKFCGQKCG